MLFAHLKRILKLDRLRLRGPNGARDELLPAATATNLRKMAKLLPMPVPAVAARRPRKLPSRPGPALRFGPQRPFSTLPTSLRRPDPRPPLQRRTHTGRTEGRERGCRE